MTGLIVNKVQGNKLADYPKVASCISSSMFYLQQIKTSINSLFCTFLSINKFIMFNKNSGESNQFSIKLVKVESNIGEAKLKDLADVCYMSEKAVFLNLPHANELPQSNSPITWNVKRTLDWLAAFSILLVLSPVMFSLAVIIASSSSGPIFFHQWRIGESGKLFRIIKFRTMITDADKLHHLVIVVKLDFISVKMIQGLLMLVVGCGSIVLMNFLNYSMFCLEI